MKKTLVAMAAFAAVSSFAQSSVTLYGVADVWFGQAKGSFVGTSGLAGTASQMVLNTGGLSGSRFGLRGSEDLGGGLKANFVMENGHNTDTGAAAQGGLLFGRQTYVGMSGGFGEFRLGRQYSAYDAARGALDTVGHTSFSATVAGGAWERVGNHYTFRVDNQMLYNTPNMSGFSASVGYGLRENKTATVGAGRVLSMHVLYANGPITAAAAYQTEKATGAGPTLTNFLVGGAYDLGVAKVNLEINNAKNSNIDKDSEMAFGVTVPFGATAVSLAYGTAKNKAAAGGATIEKGNTIGLQVTHALSKRTTIYGGLVNGSVKSGAGAAIEKNAITAIGMRHTF
ncbi:porin [Variovorax sp. PCZ-1]|uniref:porin n=1 Tax=Variovorax sp. PCZ-1 TaxID=2835533 RepID=UPI001BCF6B3F|nr:porin [Variovorax sp. PCZ-1]MBS7809200.1 porin [Variovorax sp. PCZ-1]